MRIRRPAKTADSGFTLIELMVVVSIIAIVAAAVVPSFTMVLQSHRQREAGQLIVQAVFHARSSAARTGHCYRVRVYPSPNPADNGGTGGAVAIDEADTRDECNQVTNWTRVSYKSVGPSTDLLAGDPHVGLIGTDVSITRVSAPPSVDPDCDGALGIPNPNFMVFSPHKPGIEDLTERWFEVAAFNADNDKVGVTQYVQVSSGGATKYTLCEP